MSGRTRRVYFVEVKGGPWKYGKKGGGYSIRGHAVNCARRWLKQGAAVRLYESQEIEWHEIEI